MARTKKKKTYTSKRRKIFNLVMIIVMSILAVVCFLIYKTGKPIGGWCMFGALIFGVLAVRHIGEAIACLIDDFNVWLDKK